MHVYYCLWNEHFWLNYSILPLTNRSSNFRIGNEPANERTNNKLHTAHSIQSNRITNQAWIHGMEKSSRERKSNQRTNMSRYIRCSSFIYNGNSSTGTNGEKNVFVIRFVICLNVNNRIIGVQRFFIENCKSNREQVIWLTIFLKVNCSREFFHSIE